MKVREHCRDPITISREERCVFKNRPTSVKELLTRTLTVNAQIAFKLPLVTKKLSTIVMLLNIVDNSLDIYLLYLPLHIWSHRYGSNVYILPNVLFTLFRSLKIP